MKKPPGLYSTYWFGCYLGLPIYAARRFQMEQFPVNLLHHRGNKCLNFLHKLPVPYTVAFLSEKRTGIIFPHWLLFSSFISYLTLPTNRFSVIYLKMATQSRLTATRWRTEVETATAPMRRSRFIIAVPNAHFIGYTSSSLFMVFLSLVSGCLNVSQKLKKCRERLKRQSLMQSLQSWKTRSARISFSTPWIISILW